MEQGAEHADPTPSERHAADASPAAPPVQGERILEYLQAFHALTGLRFRLTCEAAGATAVLHDSLGDSAAAEAA